MAPGERLFVLLICSVRSECDSCLPFVSGVAVIISSVFYAVYTHTTHTHCSKTFMLHTQFCLHTHTLLKDLHAQILGCFTGILEPNKIFPSPNQLQNVMQVSCKSGW